MFETFETNFCGGVSDCSMECQRNLSILLGSTVNVPKIIMDSPKLHDGMDVPMWYLEYALILSTVRLIKAYFFQPFCGNAFG